MTITISEERELRLEIAEESDWLLFDGLVRDASSDGGGLAERLMRWMTAKEIAGDWNEFVVPDLAEGFSDDVEYVAEKIRHERGGKSGALVIPLDEALRWYGVLNQARLMLEERHGISEMPEAITDSPSGPWLRSQFYCALQSVILEEQLNRKPR